MDKAMANAQVYVVQFFDAPLPDEPRRRFFPDFIIGTPNLVRGLKVGVVHHE